MAKDLKFRFRTFALPWLPKNGCSASAVLLCIGCQRSEVPLPHCLYCQRSEVPHFRSALTAKTVKFRFRTSALLWLPNVWSSVPHFRTALTAKDLKFCFRTSALPWLAKICSSAFHTSLCQYFEKSQVTLPHLFCQDFQRCEVPLPHFISAWTSKDLQFRIHTFAQSWLPKIWRSASPLTLCLHCQIWEVRLCTSLLHWLQKICSSDFTFPLRLHFQRCKRTSALSWLLKFCLLSSAVCLYYVFPHITWRISPSERRGILIRKQKSKPSNCFYC